MLTRDDFYWKEHHSNNINSNPVDEIYCIIDVGDHARKYSIVPQYPSDDGVCINTNSDPELFILMESVGHLASESDRNGCLYEMINYNEYLFGKSSFIRAFKTEELAKNRAFIQYASVYMYAMSMIENDEKHFEKHFCATK